MRQKRSLCVENSEAICLIYLICDFDGHLNYVNHYYIYDTLHYYTLGSLKNFTFGMQFI